MNFKALGAEFVGTFMLMASILGSAFYSFAAPSGAAGIIGVAFAIGIVVMAMARSVGHISGGHFNPAVTIGLAVGGRFPFSQVIPYVLVQLLAAASCCGVFSLIGGGIGGTYAANGFGDLSMLKVGLQGVFIIEVVMTAFFLIVIMGATRSGASTEIAPIPIGLCTDGHSHYVDPCIEHIREPGAQLWPGDLCRRRTAGPALGVLRRSHSGRDHRRPDLQRDRNGMI